MFILCQMNTPNFNFEDCFNPELMNPYSLTKECHGFPTWLENREDYADINRKVVKTIKIIIDQSRLCLLMLK